ncbi:hypothetical protein PybrP1_000492 [[Pythium] brassicae (nom. inval.)]|nr:hypothetical protein PybrP1_000492 [[Pythium] brassicae (nom. inval.)]
MVVTSDRQPTDDSRSRQPTIPQPIADSLLPPRAQKLRRRLASRCRGRERRRLLGRAAHVHRAEDAAGVALVLAVLDTPEGLVDAHLLEAVAERAHARDDPRGQRALALARRHAGIYRLEALDLAQERLAPAGRARRLLLLPLRVALVVVEPALAVQHHAAHHHRQVPERAEEHLLRRRVRRLAVELVRQVDRVRVHERALDRKHVARGVRERGDDRDRRHVQRVAQRERRAARACRVRARDHLVAAAHVVGARAPAEREEVRHLPAEEQVRLQRGLGRQERARGRGPAHERRYGADDRAGPRVPLAARLHRRVHERVEADVEDPERRHERAAASREDRRARGRRGRAERQRMAARDLPRGQRPLARAVHLSVQLHLPRLVERVRSRGRERRAHRGRRERAPGNRAARHEEARASRHHH